LRRDYGVRDCGYLSKVKTLSLPGNHNEEPVQKKRKFDKKYLKISELRSEKDSENE